MWKFIQFTVFTTVVMWLIYVRENDPTQVPLQNPLVIVCAAFFATLFVTAIPFAIRTETERVRSLLRRHKRRKAQETERREIARGGARRVRQ